MARGRPTKLSPEVAALLVELVAEVGFIEPAARLAGIAPRTVQEWVQRGTNSRPGRPASEDFARFARDVSRARAEALRRRLVRIEQVGQGGFVVERTRELRRDGRVVERERVQPPDWRADAWVVERLDPGRFGRRRDGESALSLRQANALADGIFDAMRRWIQTEDLQDAAVEIGAAIDRALCGLHVQVPGIVGP